MRYFVCTAANRPWIAGDQTFTFEPIGLRGGSWLGVLAVDEPAASILAGSGLAQISEISEERYLTEKKKVAQEQVLSRPSAPPPPMGNPLMGPVAARAGALTTPISETPEAKAQASEVLQSDTLLSTDQTPPPEPLLEDSSRAQRTKKE